MLYNQPNHRLPLEPLLPLTKDKRLSVRVAVGKALYAMDTNQVDHQWQSLVKNVQREWLQSQNLILDTPEANMELGNAFLARQQISEAEQRYLHALTLDSNLSAAMVNLAFLNRANGNNTKAISLLKKAIEAQPNDGNTHYALAMTYVQSGQLQAAIPYLRQSVHLNNLDDKPLLALALVLEQQKQYRAAYLLIEERMKTQQVSQQLMHVRQRLEAQFL